MKLFKHLPVLLFSVLLTATTTISAPISGGLKNAFSQDDKAKSKEKEKSKSDKKGGRTRSYTPPKKDK